MWSILNFLSGKNSQNDLISSILAQPANRESLLGTQPPNIPSPEGIRQDAANILKYTTGKGYKKFAEEAWSQIISGIDKILDPRTSRDQRDFYCGEVNATLNLLRMSAKAQYIVEEYDKSQVSLRPDSTRLK